MEQSSNSFNLQEYVLHHVQNSTSWKLPFLPPVELPFHLTVHGLMILLTSVFLVFLFCFVYRKEQKVPTGITNLLEAFVIYIRDEICIANLGDEDGRKMTPLFCTFFFYILLMNLMGLVPVLASATANINVTFALALITFGYMTIGAIYRNGVGGFVNAFMNHDLPTPLRLTLFFLEILGIFIKTFALTVRLFANIIAGHMVILIFLGLLVILGWIALPSLIIAFLITMLEIFVAFLQAYIFTMLSALFIGQIYHPSH